MELMGDMGIFKLALISIVCGVLAAVSSVEAAAAMLGIAVVGVLGIALPEFALAAVCFSGRFKGLPGLCNLPDPVYLVSFALPGVALSTMVRIQPTDRSWLGASSRGLVYCILFGMWLLLGVGYTPGPKYGMQKATEFLLYTFPMTAIALRIGRSGFAHAKKTIIGYYLAGLIMGLIGLIGFLLRPSLSRLALKGGGPIVFGRMTGLAAVCGAGLLLVNGKESTGPLESAVRLASIFLLMIASLLSGSRGNLISGIVGLAFIALAALQNQDRVNIRTCLIVALGVVLGVQALAVVVRANPSIAYRFSLLLAEDKGASINVRKLYIIEAAKLFLKEPLFGYGTGSFSPLFGYGDILEYPHNVMAEIGLENGAVGLALFLLFIASIWHSYRMGRRKTLGQQERGMCQIIWAAWLFVALGSLFSGDIYDNRLVWILGGLLVGFRDSACCRGTRK